MLKTGRRFYEIWTTSHARTLGVRGIWRLARAPAEVEGRWWWRRVGRWLWFVWDWGEGRGGWEAGEGKGRKEDKRKGEGKGRKLVKCIAWLSNTIAA